MRIAINACRIVGSFVSALLLVPLIATATNVPQPPPLDRPVIDLTSTLSNEDVDSIVQLINSGRESKSYQMGVLMISSLDNESLEDYSIRVAREWGIGTKDDNNGVLLLIVKDDRKMRIEVGTGLEGGLTDARSSRIIRNVIAPEFRKNNYADGIEKGISQIQQAIDNKPESSSAESASTGSPGIFEAIFNIGFMLLFVLPWLGAILARSKSWWAGGVVGGVIGGIVYLISGFAIIALVGLGLLVVVGLVFDYLVSRNYRNAVTRHKSSDGPSWWAGGTGWGSGGSWGGGGGGFGGGGFGGGGSSGDW